jgi:predicted nucleotide-binding protein
MPKEQEATPKPVSQPSQSSKRGRKAGDVIFPRDPLKAVLPIAEAVWTQNSGNPMDMLDVAKAVNQSPTSSTFLRQLASSFRYGLTEGSQTTKVVSLTALGSQIVAPTVGVDVNSLLKKALLFPAIFQKVYVSMDGKPIPREDFFRNTLIKPPESGGFSLPKDYVDDFVRVFNRNASDYGLIDDIKGVKYLRLNKLSSALVQAPNKPAGAEETDASSEAEIVETPALLPPTEVQKPKLIFVAHGKNKKPLEQLRTILSQFKVPFEVAVDEPHKGEAISEKVIQLMKKCTSGIFIFTGDEETVDSDGNKVLRPNDNVVFELGAGIMAYGNNIVIFREEGVEFGSDFTSYGHITFEKNKLDAKGLDLMKELVSQGFLQVTPR